MQIFDNFYCIIYSLASCVMCILRISGASSSLAIAADVANQRETTRPTYTTDDRALSFSECRRTSAILIGLCNHRRHDPTVGRFNLNPPLPPTDVTRTCTHTHTYAIIYYTTFVRRHALDLLNSNVRKLTGPGVTLRILCCRHKGSDESTCHEITRPLGVVACRERRRK